MINKTNLDRILPLVQRPVRYINHEVNSVHTDEGKACVKVCLCFPDLYEIGASNLGLEILYNIINKREDALAERCYSVARDLEELMRKEKMPLFSLETKTPLKEFDVIGFTLQYELCATNILNILDMAGLPLLSKDRKDTFPLIIGGGPVTANPEPYADFFDAFVIGDGEDAINDIIEKIKVVRGQGTGGQEAGDRGQGTGHSEKKKLLLELAKIPGVYVPSFYDVEYNDNGSIKSFKANTAGAPEKIEKRSVNLETALFPDKPIIPYMDTVHNRLNIEIARGCPQRCRFCQASRYYTPYRVRPKEKILEIIEKGLKSTGYEEISLLSLSCTQYRGLDSLLDDINRLYGARRLGISLPSLRCDQFSLDIAGNLGHGKKPNLTFAPESGSERLRDVLGKDLSDVQIENTITSAWKMGWKLIKLYFMIGLPTEQEEDVQAINRLLNKIKMQAKNLNFNVTISAFVPKAQTPFQWAAMAGEEILSERLKKLIKTLPASVKYGSVKSSMLEGVFARGDRRLSMVLLKAFKKGCRFDQWREELKSDLWQEAFKEEGLGPEFYLLRNFNNNDILPWEHLVFAKKELFWQEYQKALAGGDKIENAENSIAGAKPLRNYDLPSGTQNTRAVQRLRLCFARRGAVRFVSHLEQIEFFRRLLRRAGLPMTLTAGFHPQPRMSFGPAISVGYESDSEFVEVELYTKLDITDVEAKIRAVLPDGYALAFIKRVPVAFPSLDSLVNMAEYKIGAEVPAETINAFLARPQIPVEKVKDGKRLVIDVRPLIKKLETAGDSLLLQLRFGPKKTIKTERIIGQMCGLSEEDMKLLDITRTKLFIEKQDGSVSEP